MFQLAKQIRNKKNQYPDSEHPDSKLFDDKLFEYLSAAVSLDRHNGYEDRHNGYEVRVWDDLNPEIKDILGLPEQDVGVDWVVYNQIDHNYHVFVLGQAKYYVKTKYVSSKAIDRTRLCAFHSGIKNIEFSTPENVKLNNPKIPLNSAKSCKINIEHIKISKSLAKSYYDKCLQIIESGGLDDEITEFSNTPLRDCQIDAINTLRKVQQYPARINMSCGSGKTRVALEFIKENLQDSSIVFVPSILLMHQWHERILRVFTEYKDSDILLVGTNTNWKEKLDKDYKIIICVYNSWIHLQEYIQPELVVVDEAHHIDKAESGFQLSVRQYAEKTKSVYFQQLYIILNFMIILLI